jgi:hypothetical protein
MKHQSLVGLVVIDAELGRKDHGSIFHKYDWEGLELLDARTNLQTRLNWWYKQKKYNRKLCWSEFHSPARRLEIERGRPEQSAGQLSNPRHMQYNR